MAVKVKSKLSCEGARTALATMDLEKDLGDMNEEEVRVVKHYVDCKSCRDLGLEEIIGPVSCQDALLELARYPGHLWHGPFPFPDRGTLNLLRAAEHVGGKYEWKNEQGGHGYNAFTGCRKGSCQGFYSYWLRVPMSCANDGAEGVIHEIPAIIGIFSERGWPLDRLLAIQEERVRALLEGLLRGEITVSRGHYNDFGELAEEVKANVAVLQELL